ncbi:hypothetical protein D8886_10905 [Streptococcus sanguinis]|nr:hypothetical protein D8886_10905 [Streptococcus sanguinis]
MFHKEKPDYHRCQYGFYTIDELVPEDHFLRQLESEVDFDFIYDLKKRQMPFFICLFYYCKYPK